MRLLLIEDDESLCLSLSYQLRQDGFAPETCHDGRKACSGHGSRATT